MPVQNFNPLRGRLETVVIESQAIANNILGDPTERQVLVYLPEGYDAESTSYPLFVDIAGFTSSGLAHAGWKGFGESLPQRVDRLIEEGKMGKVIVAMPDCFTSLGGNQYVNSSVLGNWADFLTQEVAPKLEGMYRVTSGARALFGKSSGGFGAIVHGMKYGEHWNAIACHSGDMDFDLAYRSDFPKVLMHLARYGGSIETFIQKVQGSQKIGGDEMHTLMILAMAATYDPAPELPFGIRLPVNPRTCEMVDELWQRWLAFDPVRMIEEPASQANLKQLSAVFIDCGSQDQYSLVFGARRLAARLSKLDIDHTYEEFSDNHSGIDYRMDVSLPFMYAALTGG